MQPSTLSHLSNGLKIMLIDSIQVRVAQSRSSYAPIANLSGSRHTRVDPGRGKLVDKEYATVEECLSQVLTPTEINDALANWRPRAASSQMPGGKPAGWLSWVFG